MKKHSWHARLTHALCGWKTLALMAVLLLSCLGPTRAEMPEYVHAVNEVCLLHEGNSWFIARFQTYVQVTDVTIFAYLNSADRRPISKPQPSIQFADSKPYRTNTLMVLLDVLQHPFSNEQEARAWKGKEGWEKGEWQTNLLREVKDVRRIDIPANKPSPQKK